LVSGGWINAYNALSLGGPGRKPPSRGPGGRLGGGYRGPRQPAR